MSLSFSRASQGSGLAAQRGPNYLPVLLDQRNRSRSIQSEACKSSRSEAELSCDEFEEAPRASPWWDVTGDTFNTAVGVVIVASALFLGLETDAENAEQYRYIEYCFGCFFVLEMVMRLHQLGFRGYCSDPSNIFDGSLVAASFIEQFIMPFLSTGPVSSQGVQMMRLLRLSRVMRILRLFKMFHELTVILQAFVKAMGAVMWVGVLVVILDYACAILLTQLVGQRADAYGEHAEDVETWFGCVGNSMRTLFIVMTLSEFDEIMLVLMKVDNPLLVFSFFALYILVTAFAMMSLITGIISESLIAAQREDEVHRVQEIEESKKAMQQNIQEFLSLLAEDQAQPGMLSRAYVMEAIASNPSMLVKLHALDIHVDMGDIEQLLARLADGPDHDKVRIADVAEGMTQMSGTAKASMLFDLKHLVLSLKREVEELRQPGARHASTTPASPKTSSMHEPLLSMSPFGTVHGSP